jgi:hypothetical protein
MCCHGYRDKSPLQNSPGANRQDAKDAKTGEERTDSLSLRVFLGVLGVLAALKPALNVNLLC